MTTSEFSAQVTRTSWALSANARTLRAEIDIPNPGGMILPNMYAFGTVELVRTDVWAIPLRAVIQIGNENCCYVLDDGKSVEVPVQLGIDDGAWVEVTRKHMKKKGWMPLDGTEQVLVGDLTQLADGQPVRVQQ